MPSNTTRERKKHATYADSLNRLNTTDFIHFEHYLHLELLIARDAMNLRMYLNSTAYFQRESLAMDQESIDVKTTGHPQILTMICLWEWEQWSLGDAVND